MTEAITRRNIVTAVAATTAAAVLPTSAVASPAMSPEYYACYRAWIDCERAKESQVCFDVTRDQAEFEISSAEHWRVAKEALLARPLESIGDVLALMRTNAWQQGHFVRIQDWAAESDEIRTLHAVEQLAGVPPWPVPEDLIALDARQRAEEAARPRILRFDPYDGCIGGGVTT